MGWEKKLLPGAVEMANLLEGLPGARLPDFDPALAWGVDSAEDATVNHEALAWGREMLRAALAVKAGQKGAAEQFVAAKQVLQLAYFPREMAEGDRGVGLWGREPMCGDTHGGFHLAGLMMIVAAAEVSRNAELRSWVYPLVSRTVRALLCVASRSGEVWSAGLRAMEGNLPRATAATEWLREMTGRPHGSLLTGKKAAANWRVQAYLAVRLARYLGPEWRRDHGLDQMTPAPCPLKYGMVVYRWPTGHLAVIPQAPGTPAKGLWNWVRCEYSGDGSKVLSVEASRDFEAQPPLPFAGARRIDFPKHGG